MAKLTLKVKKIAFKNPQTKKAGFVARVVTNGTETFDDLSLPPILYIQNQNPILNYSKALRGLSVLPRVIRIFTHTSISPGPLLRQCPNHYAIHAGQNLPDKEFRYLRTVIVTAAVHWGLSSKLRNRYTRHPNSSP